MSVLRQIIVMRTDLNMRRGKMIAQGAHASMKAFLENPDDPRFIEWLDGKFTKIAVGVGSLDELQEVYNNARDKGLISTIVVDAGLTEFGGIATTTCISVGPATKEELEGVTNHLKLL